MQTEIKNGNEGGWQLHSRGEKGEKGAKINSTISLIQYPYCARMLLLNFSPCFGFCWEKCAEKVLFDGGLPIFSVRIACLIGMYTSYDLDVSSSFHY